MKEMPTYLLTDPERRDVAVWNKVRMENPDLRYANLGGADLRSANLRNANLRGADLGGANLGYADLRGADLRGADLRSADLRNANLRNANLGGANLGYADLRGADLRGVMGARRADVCAAVPVGSGEPCSAIRNDDGTVTIWAGCETFASIKQCRARIKELGGEHEAERLAWLKWVKARLAVQP